MITKNSQIHVNYTVPVQVEAVKANVIIMVFLYKDKESGEVGFDWDLGDFENIVFMGMPVEEDYKAHEKFRQHMKGMGVNINKLLTDKAREILTDEFVLEDNKEQIAVVFK